MGCGASAAPADSSPPQQQQATVEPVLVDPTPAPAPPPAPPAPTPNKHTFQIKLKGDWQDYRDDEGEVLERAYLAGFPFAKYSLRGQDYQYDFTKNLQINLRTKKEREFRPPPGLKRPLAPIVPPGPTMIIKVPPGGRGGVAIQIPHPKLIGQFITVLLPKNAVPGKEILVPVPSDPDAKPAESASGDAAKKGGWSTKAVAASGAAAVGVGALVVGGLVVAGAVLGEDAVMDGVGAAGDALAPAGDVVGDAAMTLGDALAPAGEAIAGSAADGAGVAIGALGGGAGVAAAAMPGVIDGAGDVATDASAWILNMGESAGGFVMDLF